MLHGILWTIVVLALIIWAIGFFFAHLGTIIHILLIVAAVCILWSLIQAVMGGRTRTY
jgi:hypothetical protein